MITFPTSPTSSSRTLATRTSPSCSTTTPLSPILRSALLMKPQRVTIHETWFYSSFEDFCVTLLSWAHLRSRFALYTMSWPRNVTLPLTYCDAYMGTCTSTTSTFLAVTLTFSTIGDMSSPEFSAPGNSFLWGLGGLEEANRERTGFLIMPKRPLSGVWIHMATTSSTMQTWRLDPILFGFSVFLHLLTTNMPGLDSITRSEQAQQRRLERKATRPERRKRRRGLRCCLP